MSVKVKHHKGAWWLFIDHHGKRKAKKVGSSKRAAETAAEKIQAKIALGQFEIKDETTRRPFETYFRNWLDSYVKAHCKERTYDLYQEVFQVHLLPRWGQRDISEITREDVKQLAYDLLAQGRSRGTVKAVLTPLSTMFNIALDDGYVAVNPVVRILRRSRAEEGTHHEKVTFLTREETAHLLQACREHFPTHYPLILLLVRTGMRIGEAFGLRWEDIDFHGRFADVQRTFSNGRLSTPKNNRSRRVDLSLQLTETLKALLVERKKDTLREGWGEVPPWVFISQERTPIHRSLFAGRVWPKILAKANMRRIRIHDLRHTYASLLIQQGESLAYVKEQLGHHSIQMTVDTYGHLVPGGNQQAVDRLDGLENATFRNPAATATEDRVGTLEGSQRK
jgi:integrase